jgi:hypothetical protein
MNTIKITIFQSIKDTSAPFHRDVMDLLDRVRNGSSRDLVKEIRKQKDKSARNELKKETASDMFFGYFQ